MKPPPFEWWAPQTLEEAVKLLSEFDDPSDAKVMAGGQSLMPLLSLRLAQPRHVVDLDKVQELVGIDVSDSGRVVIGAMTRQRIVERAPEMAACPLVTEALSLVGHPQIRNRGTVGGTLAHADPAAEMPTVALCLDAEMVVSGPRGERHIPASEFFTGFLSTALAEDEILVSARFPTHPPGTGSAFVEMARRSGDFAMVGVAATISLDGDTVRAARIALSGVAATPVRAAAAEAGLVGQPASDAAFTDSGRAAAATLKPPSDLHASSDYRRHVAGVLVKRALHAASRRARQTEQGER